MGYVIENIFTAFLSEGLVDMVIKTVIIDCPYVVLKVHRENPSLMQTASWHWASYDFAVWFTVQNLDRTIRLLVKSDRYCHGCWRKC